MNFTDKRIIEKPRETRVLWNKTWLKNSQKLYIDNHLYPAKKSIIDSRKYNFVKFLIQNS